MADLSFRLRVHNLNELNLNHPFCKHSPYVKRWNTNYFFEEKTTTTIQYKIEQGKHSYTIHNLKYYMNTTQIEKISSNDQNTINPYF